MTKKLRIPSYRLHKASGQALVVLSGVSHYLGKWNSSESKTEYERLISEWLANGRRPLDHSSQQAAKSTSDLQRSKVVVNEIMLAFWAFAKKHYRHPDGRPTREQDNLRDALRPVRRMYGHTLARDFGPLALRAVQQEMIKADLCRTVINDRIKRIRRMFRWAVSMELIPPSTIQALETVPPLQKGRCDARESPGVNPVNWDVVEATLPHLPRQVSAMVQIMRYSNCRAEDVVIMRPRDIIRGEDIWMYLPSKHKNQWREEKSSHHKRIVYLGPRCQDVVSPFLDACKPEEYLFSPRTSRKEHDAGRCAKRSTNRTPSELKRKCKPKAKSCLNDCYSVNTFQQAVRRACRRHGISAWTVLQVRHTRATEVREQYGLEGAAASLGDTLEAAQIYAERNLQLAKTIAREFG